MNDFTLLCFLFYAFWAGVFFGLLFSKLRLMQKRQSEVQYRVVTAWGGYEIQERTRLSLIWERRPNSFFGSADDARNWITKKIKGDVMHGAAIK